MSVWLDVEVGGYGMWMPQDASRVGFKEGVTTILYRLLTSVKYSGRLLYRRSLQSEDRFLNFIFFIFPFTAVSYRVLLAKTRVRLNEERFLGTKTILLSSMHMLILLN
ncbi:hypothetical protein AAMO2058_001691400 [Amorphochlora amoebiformis]